MKKHLLIIAVLGAVLLAGCSFGKTTENKLSKVLGDMYSAEETYRDNQAELKALEQDEQNLFNKTMELTKEERQQVAENVDTLQKILADRTEKIAEEEEAMKKAEDYLAKFDEIAEKVEQNEQEAIEKLKEAVARRYEAHTNFIIAYKELTSMQKELYELLTDKEADVTTLNERVDKINAQNGVVLEVIEKFNDATNQLNSVRDEVYDTLDKES